MSFSFIDQMEENVRFNLCYPYHMNREKMQNPGMVHPCLLNHLHTHSFEMLLKRAYQEPFAFYLTEEDMKAYSAQELEFIARVIALEQKRINSGQCIVDLELDADSMEYLMQYKQQHNLTFEEAVVDILTKMMHDPRLLTTTSN